MFSLYDCRLCNHVQAWQRVITFRNNVICFNIGCGCIFQYSKWGKKMSIILLILICILKAAADTVKHSRSSKLADWLPKWIPLNAGKHIRYTNYPLDWWHVINSVMIALIIALVTLVLWQFALIGIAYILIFNFCYNKLFK